jgi:hypothetical protein
LARDEKMKALTKEAAMRTIARIKRVFDDLR